MATAAAFDNLVTLLEAYQRLGDSDDEDDGDIDPAAAANGDGGDGEGDGEEEDSDELSQYASFLLANSDNDGGSGQGGAELGEVHNGDDDGGGGFAMSSVETHSYEDAIIVGSTDDDYHVDAGSSLHHGDDELPLPPPGSAGNTPPLEAVAMSFLQEAAAMRLRQGTTNGDGQTILVQRLGELLRAYRANAGAPRSGRQRPASAAAVAALEKRKHDGGGVASSSSSGAAAAQCVICIEDYEVGDDISVMPCSYGHSFHQTCLADWLARSRFCPLCRHKLPAADDDKDDELNGQTP
uniref:RING-type domain-containing protein n=1 Tax=Oryza punctata TaxID=4537 RepID=A0A0E0MCH1_ORYPU